ncbi:hypothetical protein JQ596_37290 [Bradyrhizobium manausense]|uniref:hypothetical protein n=1 Tax=Bradyrhizobium TaxID=374 RepID=UPI001BA7CA6D|nr:MULTISPECIES: hypothetical protein [Bradyrhizobium]MBR0831178.1 hypothetical protein [Bradyrhizobium manausense]UVO32653.1 hypothetical protein KUF59_19525 [Bradyrhizobium arachidis]
MAFDYWWIGLFVDEREHARIQPHFAAAAAESPLSAEARQAIDDWRAHPYEYEEDAWLTASDELASRVRAFSRAFNRPGFVEFARQLLTIEGALSDLVDERHVFRMTITARHPTVSIVWHALGSERAQALPGQMGNLLLSPPEVEAALETTRQAYEGVSREELLAAARRFCRCSVGDDTLDEAVSFLPDGLEAAIARRAGFLGLACPQI